MMIFKRQFSTFTTLLIATMLWMAGCMPNSGENSGRKSKSTAQTTTTTGPTSAANPKFSDSLNYFQNGETISTASFTIDLTFSDSFYLRGSEVHQYLASGNLDVACFAFNFPSIDGSSKTLILAGNPRSFYNFTSKTKENYFFIEPANRALNTTFCQTPGPLNYVGLNFPSSTLAYALGDICTNCGSFLLDSSPVEVISSGGNLIKNIQTHYLDLRVKTQGTQSTIETGIGCITSSECTNKGFDCCSSGQCVKDLALKSGVDITSAEYLQAQTEIAISTSNIYNYPNLYHICSKQIAPTPTPVVTENPYDAAALRLNMLAELYQCTSPVLGEMSVCTVTYNEANKNMLLAGFTGFVTAPDDRSFSTTHKNTTPIAKHGVYEVIHAGTTLFKYGDPAVSTYVEIPEFGSGSFQGGWNDDLTTRARVVLKRAKPVSATNDDLKIKFMIDGSCAYINSTLAKCHKYYVQGQPYGAAVTPQLTDHYPASNKFSLPSYADAGRAIRVEVDGTLKTAEVDWTLVQESTKYIQFATNVQVLDTQTVKIEFFVTLSGTTNVMQSKLTTLNTIDQLCNCGGPYCTLKPVTQISNGVTKITDYSCVYPQPETVEPPMQQNIYLSAQTVPYRYFDKSGVHHTSVKVDTPEQENSSNGVAPFEYTGGNLLRPNNLTQYIGFNEIYGSFKYTANSARPAKEVIVKNGKTYDIFTDYGSLSTCSLCGNDYYATLTKIFPTNFSLKGGGYRPETNKTDRFKVSTYRADDLLYGRACFIPATMIPWTHSKNADLKTQRRNRLAAQHFLFANGYQRDWYGFDYGAVIGSFDGINWFAIGNQRRIKATGNRLYLAINTYFGDQTIDSTFTITISEANLTIGSGSQITVDDKNDGAECRKYHQCTTDSDCITQLGWEYSCENVGLIKTNWPAFDSNGVELADQERANTPLYSLLAGVVSEKRCVYRARGAPCHTQYNNISSATAYNGVENTASSGGTDGGLLSCAPNFYCQSFLDGSEQALFNNRISRFGKSPSAQNLSEYVPETEMDTFGLAARLIGRPYRYNGTELITSSGARSGMSRNNIVALCIPGKDPGAAGTTFLTNNSKKPVINAEEKFNGDQVLNIGMSSKGSTKKKHYLSACGILNKDNNYIYKINPEYRMDGSGSGTDGIGSGVAFFAASQTTSTNLLSIFNNPTYNNVELTKNFSSELIESFAYQPNRCLRMPGSACFSDQDCVANHEMATALAEADPEQSVFDGSGALSSFELRFWQTELICGQGVSKTNSTYDLKKNRCCRDLGKDFKIAYGTNGVPLVPEPTPAPLIETDYTRFVPITQDFTGTPGFKRNSQAATYLLEQIEYGTGPSTGSGHPIVQYPVADSCTGTCATFDKMLGQFNTIQTLGKKMCCSGHWVRNFHEENGGGHKWEVSKQQAFSPTLLRCLNWSPCTTAGLNCGGDGTIGSEGGFTCEHTETPDDTKCLIKGSTSVEAERIFDYLGRLELLGIPQVPILHRTTAASNPSGTTNYLQCRVHPEDQKIDGSTGPTILPELLSDTSLTAQGEIGSGATRYYSAANMANFDEDNGMQPIFSPDTLSCCKPAGTVMDINEDSSNCCTGFVSGNPSNLRRCALPYWTDITLYTNKYVSSALKDLDLFNGLSTSHKQIYQETGYIMDTSVVIAAACTLKLCDGDTLATGIAFGPYNVPGHAGDSCDGSFCKINRYIQGEVEESGMGLFFKAGVRWNTHVYCVPPDTDGAVINAGMTLIRCNR